MSTPPATAASKVGSVAFMNAIRAMPARTASFAGYPGPVGLFGASTVGNNAASIAMDSFKKHGMRTCGDFYSSIELHEDMSKSITKPPNSTTFMPTIDCGLLKPGPDEPGTLVNDALRATSAMMTEKGIVPVCLADTADAVVPMIEGIRQITGEEFFLFHMGANTLMDTEDAPLTQVFRRGLNKNCLSLGNRGVSKFARQVRRQHEVRYVDQLAIFYKGVFTTKDIRNQYPGFLIIDVGVLDPAFAPGVAEPECGGMSTRDLLHLLSVLRGTRVMGAVITGFDPRYDVLRGPADTASPADGVTALAMAKITKEVITKTYSMSVLTAAEGHDQVKQFIAQGKVPEKYPD